MNIGEMFVRLGIELTDYAKGIEEAQGKLAQLERSFTTVGKTLSVALTAPLAALAAMGASNVSVFSGFESAMLKVSAVAQTTGEELTKLKDQAIQLGADTVFSAGQAAEAMGAFATSGFNASQIYAAMPGVLNLASAGQLEVAKAAEITASVLHGFALEADQSGRVADVLSKAATVGATSVTELGVAFQYVGPSAAALKIPFEETAAAIAVLGRAGVQGSAAGTALTSMLRDLLNPSSKAKEIMKDLGISVTDTEGKFKTLSAILLDLKNAGIAEGSQGMAAAMEIFGRRANEVSTLVRSAGTEFDSFVVKMNNAAGTTSKIASILQSGIAGSWEQLNGSIETLAIKLGEAFAPLIKPIIDWAKNMVDRLTDFVKWLETLSPNVRTAVLALATFAAAIGPVLVGLGALTGMVANLRLIPTMLLTLGDTFVSVGSKFSGFSQAITSALNSISFDNLKSLGSVATAAFKSFGTAIVDGIKSIPGALGSLKSAFVSIGPLITSAIGPVIEAAKTGVAVVALQFEQMAAAITLHGGGIQGALGALGSVISGFASSVASSLPAALAAARTAMTAFAASALPVTAAVALIVAAVTALAAVGYVIYKNWNEIGAVLVGIWKDLQNAFSAFGNWFMQKIEDVFGSAMAGKIRAIWQGLGNFFSGLWSGIINVLQNGLKYLLEAAQAAANAIGASNTSSALSSWIQKLDGMDQAAKKAAAGVSASMRASADAAMGSVGPIAAVAATTNTLALNTENAKDKAKALKDAQKDLAAQAKDLDQATHKLTVTLNDLPENADDFVNKFLRVKEIPPELKKMQSYVDDLKGKLKDLGVAADEAFSKGKTSLGQGLTALMLQFEMAIQRQEDFMHQFEVMTNMDKDFSGIIKQFQLMNDAALSTNIKLMEIPPIIKQIGDANLAKMFEAPINEAGALKEAFKGLGVTSAEAFSKAASQAEIYYKTVEAAYQSGKASATDLKAALLALTDAQIKAGAAGGENVDALREKSAKLRAELEASGYALKNHGAQLRTYWQELDKQISTILTDFGKGIADAMFSAKSLGDFFSTVFENMAKTIVRFTVEYWTKIWLTELYKGIKGLDLFGQAADVATTKLGGTVKTAADAGTGIKDSVGDASKASQAGGLANAGGLLGAIGAIGSVVSAIMDVLSYFQGRRIEKDVGRIEVTTRGILNQLVSIQESLNTWLGALENLSYLQRLDLNISQLAEVISSNFESLLKVLAQGISVDGSGSGIGAEAQKMIDALQQQLKELQDKLNAAVGATGQNTGAAVDNSEATSENTDAQNTTAAATNTNSVVQDYSTTAVSENTDATDKNTDSVTKTGKAVDENGNIIIKNGAYIGLLGEQLGNVGNTIATASENVSTSFSDASTSLGNSVQEVTNAWVKTGEMVASSVDSLSASLYSVSTGTAQIGKSTESSMTLQEQVDALAQQLGVGTKAPIYTDPQWQKYFDLVRELQDSQQKVSNPGGLGISDTQSSSKPLFDPWPTYESIFGSATASMYEQSLANATQAFNSQYSGLTSTADGLGSGYTSPGESAVQAAAGQSVNNFYFSGVTDPQQIANKIVTGLRTRGVDM